MESLSETTWDVVLSGTGLPQSLLALALSRSDKKVLHIDKNDYYGGSEAALSLQEAEEWAESAGEHYGRSPFRNITIWRAEQESDDEPANVLSPKLDFPRAYSLSLSPQVIYTRSNLLPALVSSKVYRQLEFLAIGDWWLYRDDEEIDTNSRTAEKAREKSGRGSLRKIPGGREDVFADKTIDRRSMMSLMKFLKLAADSEVHASVIEEWGRKPFSKFLDSQFKVPSELQELLLALTFSPNTPAETTTEYALPRIHRHLTSIGIFGPGFGSVLPKWGGLSEIAQVACRAGAVGGGVYVLKKGIVAQGDPEHQVPRVGGVCWDPAAQLSILNLEGGDEVKAHWVVVSKWDLPPSGQGRVSKEKVDRYVARSITVVSGTLSQLFSSPTESAPPPAGAIIVFPVRKLREDVPDATTPTPKSESTPVYLMVHSADTGECPKGQCIVYGHSFHTTAAEAHGHLQTALERLLLLFHEEPPPVALWSMHYDQEYPISPEMDDHLSGISSNTYLQDHVLQLPDVAPGLVLEDDVLEHVRAAYRKIMGDDSGFMMFEDREGVGVEVDSSE